MSFNPPPLPYDKLHEKDSSRSSSSGSKITPAILFIIIVLAVVFFVSGLLHLLVRFIIKHRSSISESSRYHEGSRSGTMIQRQLQQLFNLHDSGLSQAFIDALPVFLYKEIMGLKEPFDCAVCLCEFLEQDKLRLLPMCSHAFHIDCIDTWLLSNSTCPLCRGALFTSGFAIENPIFYFEDRQEEGFLGSGEDVLDSGQRPVENEIVSGKRVFPVRLGKYKSSTNGNGIASTVGETSTSNLDARRCYSMGSYQYVVGNSELQVALCANRDGVGGGNSNTKLVKGSDWHYSNDGEAEGKRIIHTRSKGESFSVSKIWLWSKKDKFTGSSDTDMSSYSVNTGLPWMNRNQYT